MVPKSPHGQESPVVIYLVLPSSYAASKIQLQTGQINQCTCRNGRKREGQLGRDRDGAMCQVYFWTSTTLLLFGILSISSGDFLLRRLTGQSLAPRFMTFYLAASWRNLIEISAFLWASPSSAVHIFSMTSVEMSCELKNSCVAIKTKTFPPFSPFNGQINRVPTCA